MAGYQSDYSMSNNAIEAYDNGLLPASKIKGVPAPLIAAHCRYEEWHHSSSKFNKVKFYNPEYVLATFGLEISDDHAPSPAAIAALTAHKSTKKRAAEVYINCRVEWREWRCAGRYGKKSCERMSASSCTVSIKAQTATITTPDGKSFIKRLATTGFNFAAC